MNLLFSQFGLVHDIHIPVSDHIASALPSPQPTTLGYGFVKFYSLSAASSAQQGLDRRGKIGGRSLRVCWCLTSMEICTNPDPLQVQFAARRQAPLPSSHHLYHPKCQELANHYLGFNSWSVSIVSMVTCEDGGGGGKVCYQCSVQLTLRLCECVSVGVGRGEAQVLSPTERAKVIGTAKKLAYRRACENAFSKVIIAVLPSGKAIPEVTNIIVHSHIW